MNADWNTSSSALRVLQHADDARPAWLWSQDGQRLIWQNTAAALFLAKIKKHGLKRAAPAMPIKGQISRNIRLGSNGRTSLARIQFQAGDKPVSSTCATTPLLWEEGQPVLLIVAVDAIAPEIISAAAAEIMPEGEAETALPEQDRDAWTELAEEVQSALVETASDDNIGKLIAADETAYQQELDNWRAAETEPAPALTVVPEAEANGDSPGTVEPAVAEPLVEYVAEPGESRLSSLVDRLAADEALYAPLTAADDVVQTPPEGPEEESSTAEPAAPETSDPEIVERVSRYNFDELSRILNDRVGETATAAMAAPTEPQRSGALINLGGETLVLNRLPLGILVFRDQQVLFANRAITEMVGYDSVENLRAAGLASVFPAAGPEGQEAGPVNHLVQRDGTLVPVTARLQSISWQGRPALMLSASATEVRTGHEGAVRAFAEAFADVRGDGFFDANPAGVIGTITGKAATLLGDTSDKLRGRPLTGIVAEADLDALREFLERPARFAETERPCLTLRTEIRNAEIILFAQGQAGIVTGYFGFVRGRDLSQPRLAGPSDADPALLSRISRGVRRPLNTIIGFSDLIRSKASGTADSDRYETYALDITTAGQEIAALVDELDDYARLRDGRYLPQRASIELTSLLETCVMRIRQQAGNARVIVRNAISESLPRVTADRASLAQAVLNLLASAIDQTPTGGAVVISAQREDDGGIAIHVRDSSTTPVDMAERFVVFRDGVNRDGKPMVPIRSSVGLALTRSLLAVNAFTLSVDPAGAQGMLFTLSIPPDLVNLAQKQPEQPAR